MPTVTDGFGLSRRAWLGGVLAGGLVTTIASARSTRQELLSAWDERAAGARGHRAGLMDSTGIALPERAHQVAADPTFPKRAWAVARRPGEWMWRLDLARGRLAAAVPLDDQRRFEGHVCPWLVDGRVVALYDTESRTEDGGGLVVIRDPTTLELRSEFSTAGVGPHELRRTGRDGLVVANGGLLLLPETGREVRNPANVTSDLVWLDSRDGRVRERCEAPLRGLSLRHVAEASDGTVGVAMQAVDEVDGIRLPVFAIRRPGRAHLALAIAGDELLARLRGYAGAVAAVGDTFAVTCPRGDRVILWHATGRLLAEIELPGPCGVVAAGTGWWVSSRDGGVYEIDAEASRVRLRMRRPGRVWDNHIG